MGNLIVIINGEYTVAVTAVTPEMFKRFSHTSASPSAYQQVASFLVLLNPTYLYDIN